jgi:hypothetical protein
MKQGARREYSLFYKHFELPERLYAAPKELVYRPRPFCATPADGWTIQSGEGLVHGFHTACATEL